MIGDIIEDAAQHVVVGELIQRRRREAETDADDVDDEVVVSERAQLPKDEADDEDEAAEDVEARQPPALVMATTSADYQLAAHSSCSRAPARITSFPSAHVVLG